MVVILVGTLRQVPTDSRIENSDVWILGRSRHVYVSVYSAQLGQSVDTRTCVSLRRLGDLSLFQFQSGCRQSLNDGIMHVTGFVIGGRRNWSTDTATWTKFSLPLQRSTEGVVEAIFQSLATSPSERKRCSTDIVLGSCVPTGVADKINLHPRWRESPSRW